HGDRFALEVLHRPHAATAYDHVGPVGHVHYENDPRLQAVDGEPEQLIEADDHAVDGLVAKSAMHFARRRILHELYDCRIQTAELPREVKRLAPYPDIRADAQGGFRFAHATEQRKARRGGGTKR